MANLQQKTGCESMGVASSQLQTVRGGCRRKA